MENYVLPLDVPALLLGKNVRLGWARAASVGWLDCVQSTLLPVLCNILPVPKGMLQKGSNEENISIQDWIKLSAENERTITGGVWLLITVLNCSWLPG